MQPQSLLNPTLLGAEIIPRPRITTDRIVFALAPESRDFFFPIFDKAKFQATPVEWIDLTTYDDEAWQEALEVAAPTVLVAGWGTPAIPDRFSRSADSSLRYICHLAGSVKGQVPRRLIERGVLVSNWGTSVSYMIAEHALLLVLGALRNVRSWDACLEHWPENPGPFRSLTLQTRSLRGSRVGLHGFGAIARELVQMLKSFQVEISSYSYGVPKNLFQENQVHCCDSLEELFSTSNIIIECEALTPRSEGSVTEEILKLLPIDAVFVNVGRGPVVDERALIRLASEGRIRLGLDVYQKEPLPRNSPFYQIPQAFLSPHIAGPTGDGFSALADFAIRNIRHFLSGAEVEGRVTLEAYDRST